MNDNCYTGTNVPPILEIEPCGGIYKSTECIVHENAIPYLNLPEKDSSVKNIINNLVLALLYKDEQIANQTTIIEELQEQTTPKYKVYSALLSQSGTNAPTATVLENTLGQTITWSYNGTGNWVTNDIVGATQDNLWINISKKSNNNYLDVEEHNTGGASSVYLYQFDIISNTPINNLEKGYIEIRVYN